MTIIRVNNRFSQNWCTGQVVLFAEDIIEVAEQLPLQLTDARIVLVAQHLENVQRFREFQIDLSKIRTALSCLMVNHALYNDVWPYFPDGIEISEIVRLENSSSSAEVVRNESQSSVRISNYSNISGNVGIPRGSFDQSNEKSDEFSRDKQYTGITASACLAFFVSDPVVWYVSDVDYILVAGDSFY